MINKIDPKLLKIVVCPKDKADLIPDEENNQLVCSECKKRYNITESGIPIFLSPKDTKGNK